MMNKVAGILRVKNDGMFIERCIESCIDALDELIVVYNDCTDNSVAEIDKMVARYPNKIKRYEYPHRILGMNITREEYEVAKNLPEGHPSLISTYNINPEKPDVPLNKNDAFQKVQKRRVQEKR